MAAFPENDTDIECADIRVTGVVQGVGFRPFIYNLAHSLALFGYVFNDDAGVLISAEGARSLLKTYIRRIEEEAPPLSHIDTITA
jgi:hydrogenase maturation protein HypF